MDQSFLYPINGKTRRSVDISGIWDFKIDTENKGRTEGWQDGLEETRFMAVPSSYNDVLHGREDGQVEHVSAVAERESDRSSES